MKCSIQILKRAEGFLAFNTEELAFYELYSDELVLSFKGASEPCSLFKNDVAAEDFDFLVQVLRSEFPNISNVVK